MGQRLARCLGRTGAAVNTLLHQPSCSSLRWVCCSNLVTGEDRGSGRPSSGRARVGPRPAGLRFKAGATLTAEPPLSLEGVQAFSEVSM